MADRNAADMLGLLVLGLGILCCTVIAAADEKGAEQVSYKGNVIYQEPPQYDLEGNYALPAVKGTYDYPYGSRRHPRTYRSRGYSPYYGYESDNPYHGKREFQYYGKTSKHKRSGGK